MYLSMHVCSRRRFGTRQEPWTRVIQAWSLPGCLWHLQPYGITHLLHSVERTCTNGEVCCQRDGNCAVRQGVVPWSLAAALIKARTSLACRGKSSFWARYEYYSSVNAITPWHHLFVPRSSCDVPWILPSHAPKTPYHPNCSQWNSTAGPSSAMSWAAVSRATRIKPVGPHAATRTRWSFGVACTALRMSDAMSGRVWLTWCPS